MRVLISQPRYLPHISYIKRLYFADLFIILDNVQRQASSVENRNKILYKDGKARWVTIPVKSSKRSKICFTIIDGSLWIEQHKRKIIDSYSNHPFYDEKFVNYYYLGVDDVLHATAFNYSSTIIQMLFNLCEMLSFKPRIIRATELDIPEAKGLENFYNILKAVGADTYISGSNGRVYGAKEYLEDRGIKVLFHDPEPFVYAQKNAKCFVDWLAFFDPLFNVGLDRVMEYIKAPPVLKES